MKVSVVIVTYNGFDWLRKCIAPLQLSTIPLEVIVVDNASTDQTVDYIKKYYPFVVLIESDVNLGFGKANNIGIKYAVDHGADFVFLLNQDAWVKSNSTIQELVRIAERNPEFGLISPVHLTGNGSALDPNFSDYVSERVCSGFVADFFSPGKIDRLYDVPFVNAAAWLLPVSTIKNYGYFDDAFFMYGEDVEYCSRLTYHRVRIGVTKKSFIHHARDRHFFKRTTFLKRIRQQFLFQKASCLMKYFNYQNEPTISNIFYKNLVLFIKEITRCRFLSVARFLGALSFVWGGSKYRKKKKMNKAGYVVSKKIYWEFR